VYPKSDDYQRVGLWNTAEHGHTTSDLILDSGNYDPYTGISVDIASLTRVVGLTLHARKGLAERVTVRASKSSFVEWRYSPSKETLVDICTTMEIPEQET
jgi:hypothetical protein